MQLGELQFGEMPHFFNTPHAFKKIGEMQSGEMQFGEMQLSPFIHVSRVRVTLTLYNEKRKNNSCKSKANILYSAVNLFSQSSYTRSDKDFDANISFAFCGTSIVKDILAYSPFYKKRFYIIIEIY
ncbi:hypothetical protein H8356DRAFT_1290116 [Neocallimastix lanati (nom. inval.)]|uniref:Uncharacterized protein n=1 Tax=Neocallimastix californiae TaxID=1754190 RepID=A0A1Y2DWX7_9FUNG|nr:hypothetical protein H8356DRAFT_1290116 [Neocallimastix sp. JGI-2020a]ORY63604.1 hypothetical protein LY90DRAFT_642155 [Neocallimastix californiae]|eukprot:ORY63604.1 hypothetical protein LY90DRAFT_642155 [Neocallimastix californiae]